MTRLLALAAFAALWSATALAQAPASAPAPAAGKPAAAPAMQADKPATAPAPPADKPAVAPGDIKIVQGAGQSKVTEDARRCLEMSTNTEVIKCAEPYLPARMK